MEERFLIYHYRLFAMIEKGFHRRYKSSEFDQCFYKDFIVCSEHI